ncbi:MAG: hypothetical protein RL701_1800 [Pseudomonadota bacterium]|jgi:hypothetical protein
MVFVRVLGIGHCAAARCTRSLNECFARHVFVPLSVARFFK